MAPLVRILLKYVTIYYIYFRTRDANSSSKNRIEILYDPQVEEISV